MYTLLFSIVNIIITPNLSTDSIELKIYIVKLHIKMGFISYLISSMSYALFIFSLSKRQIIVFLQLLNAIQRVYPISCIIIQVTRTNSCPITVRRTWAQKQIINNSINKNATCQKQTDTCTRKHFCVLTTFTPK